MNRRYVWPILVSASLHLGFLAWALWTPPRSAPTHATGPLSLQWSVSRSGGSDQKVANAASDLDSETAKTQDTPSDDRATHRFAAGGVDSNRADKGPSSHEGRPSSGGPTSIGNSDPYYSQVRARIESHVHYPAQFARRRLRGRVQVALVIEANGSLGSIQVQQSSGSGDLDQLAVESVRAAAPFPPFTAEVNAGVASRALTLPIDFRLQ